LNWVDFSQPQFWIAVLQIIWINILLSGDNALVIAMACRKLPPRERFWGMVIGAGVASVLLIVFTGLVATLMTLPYLQVIGACALFWIATKLLVPEDEHAEGSVEAVEDLWRAVKIVVVADIVMSLDNVIAVAAAAKGSYTLLTLGLVISIPMVIAGSAIIMALLERFPIFIWAGAALLGWIAGGLLAGDPAIEPYLHATAVMNVDMDSAMLGAAKQMHMSSTINVVELAFGLTGALLVLAVGGSIRRKRLARAGHAAELVERPVPIEAQPAREEALS
jgi:YjbE family integral membrane protein